MHDNVSSSERDWSMACLLLLAAPIADGARLGLASLRGARQGIPNIVLYGPMDSMYIVFGIILEVPRHVVHCMLHPLQYTSG